MNRLARALSLSFAMLITALLLAASPPMTQKASADCFFRFIGTDCIDQQGERRTRRQQPDPTIRECYFFCPAGPAPRVERPVPQFDWLQPRGGPPPQRRQRQPRSQPQGDGCAEFEGTPLEC